MKPTKKRRVIASEDEEDSENADNNQIKKTIKKIATKRNIPDDEPQAKTPKAKVLKKTPAKEKEDDLDEEDEESGKDALLKVDNMNKVWAHETLNFLQPNQIRDKNKNRPNDPEYDPRTLHVPQDFKLKQTPGKFNNLFNVTNLDS